MRLWTDTVDLGLPVVMVSLLDVVFLHETCCGPRNESFLCPSCTCLVHRLGEPCGGRNWNLWNLKLDIHHVLVTGVLYRVDGRRSTRIIPSADGHSMSMHRIFS